MFKRLFGNTIEEELSFIQPRLIVTLVVLAVSVAAALLHIGDLSAVIGAIFLFVWGWPAVKKLFFITTVGALFSRNIIIGVVLFLIYVCLSYLLGVFVALIALCRFIYLEVVLNQKKG